GLNSFAVKIAGVFVVGFADHVDAVGRGHGAVAVGTGGGLSGVDIVVGEEDVILGRGRLGVENRGAVIDAGELVLFGIGDAEEGADGGEEIDVGNEVIGNAGFREEFGIRPD